MSKYNCNFCNAPFKQKGHLKNHLLKKKKCYEINTNKFECVYCFKSYASNNNLQRHIDESCKVLKLPINKTIVDKLKKLEDEIKKLKENEKEKEGEIKKLKEEEKDKKFKEVEEENKKLKELLEKSNNTKNVTNNITNNNCTFNNVVIVAYGTEDMDLITQKEILSAFKCGREAPLQLMETIHFNPRYPNFQNVYIQNIKEYGTIYDGKEWIIKSKNEIINDLYTTQRDYLVENVEKYNKLMNASKIRSLRRLLDADEKNDDQQKTRYSQDNDVIKSIKKDMELLAYNKRHIPIKNRKKMELMDKKK
jgi:hypothetical protein